MKVNTLCGCVFSLIWAERLYDGTLSCNAYFFLRDGIIPKTFLSKPIRQLCKSFFIIGPYTKYLRHYRWCCQIFLLNADSAFQMKSDWNISIRFWLTLNVHRSGYLLVVKQATIHHRTYDNKSPGAACVMIHEWVWNIKKTWYQAPFKRVFFHGGLSSDRYLFLSKHKIWTKHTGGITKNYSKMVTDFLR